MLYVLIEAQRAWLEKVQKDSELTKRETRTISEDKRGFETEQSRVGVLRPPLIKEPAPSFFHPQIQDSEWFTLSPQKRLAWAKASRDPRISEGQQSPLEKRLLSLGGVHTTAARHLVTQKCQAESKALCREQAHSLDYWLAKAESYYYKKIVEMIKKDTGGEMKMKVGEETLPIPEGQKLHYLVPEREKRQIERHILRTGQAREFKSKTWRQTQRLSETILPRISPETQSIPLAQRRRQVKERELHQIKDHQERMIRGRELLEQRLKDRILRMSQSQIPPPERRSQVKKERKEFERVVAYPLYQPSSTSRIKVDILMEKSLHEKEVNVIIKPYRRKFLAVPPFLRTQIGKIKNP
uniref:RNA polymerase I subunit H, antisense n=1 Tax=Cricetulus griseus TaxID=10029 RepID=A0A8C2M7Y1_CRIGR